jgi:hypothetical protein
VGLAQTMHTHVSKCKNNKNLKKKVAGARCQWPTPAILATQEAEISRIMVQSQPRANSL